MSDAEDTITITTKSRYYKRESVSNPAVTFDSLLAAITEVYAQANQIGWETRCLDELTAWIRSARESAIS